MKKYLLILMFFFVLKADAHVISDHYKSALNKRIIFYPLYYNALKLTSEQISEFEYIIETYNKKYDDLLKNDINYRDIRRISREEDSEIKKILDKRQKSRYRIIRHLERFDLKKSIKEKDYYKFNPRLSVFGDLKKK